MLTALQFIVKGTSMSTILSTIRLTQGAREYSIGAAFRGRGRGCCGLVIVTVPARVLYR